MQIKINLQIFLFIIIFLLTHQFEIYVYIMLFTLIHELGHMLAGIFLKLKPRSLRFMPFGISILFEDYGYKKLISIKKIMIALSGPATNALIIILSIIFKLNKLIIFSNLLIALFNLIPIYPLDGGRIIKEILKIKIDNRVANKIVNKMSNITIIVLTVITSVIILYLRNIAIIFILMVLWGIVIKENKKYKIKRIIYDSLQNNNKCIDI